MASIIAPVEYFDAACCNMRPSACNCHGLKSLGEASASARTSSGSRPISPRFIDCKIAPYTGSASASGRACMKFAKVVHSPAITCS